MQPPASDAIAVRGSVRALHDRVVVLAPGPKGSLYIAIPTASGPVRLARLDASGRPKDEWPVSLAGTDSCQAPLPVDDGSVRVVCRMQDSEGSLEDHLAAFGFDSKGRRLTGWPVDLPASTVVGRMVGEDLVLFAEWSLGDVIEEGQPYAAGEVATIHRNGKIEEGVDVPMDGSCCGNNRAVAADGRVYGTWSLGEPDPGSPQVSRISSLDRSGVRDGWPIKIDGIASGPAFEPDGRIVVTVGARGRSTSRVLAFGPDGKAADARSPKLPLETVSYPDTGGCAVSTPRPPIVARDGTIYVYSELDSWIYGLDRSLSLLSDWPFQPGTPLVRPAPGYESEHEAGFCPLPAVPAVGPDGTLYLALEARTASVGGSLLAVGRDSQVVDGWPVELKRPGAEFWSVVVGADGTVYTLAIEPEPHDAKSASVLAIAPDSMVRYNVTLIDP